MLAEVVKSKLTWLPCIERISTAASLANYGLLGAVQRLDLENLDLASVPKNQQISLVSCVSESLKISNVCNVDMVSILDHINCAELYIENQNLCIKETNKIVKAMETKIEKLVLGGCEGAVILDIMTLIKYSGRGRCGEVTSWYAATDKYKKKILKWAKRINWDIREIDEFLRIKRVQKARESCWDWEPFSLSNFWPI